MVCCIGRHRRVVVLAFAANVCLTDGNTRTENCLSEDDQIICQYWKARQFDHGKFCLVFPVHCYKWRLWNCCFQVLMSTWSSACYGNSLLRYCPKEIEPGKIFPTFECLKPVIQLHTVNIIVVSLWHRHRCGCASVMTSKSIILVIESSKQGC